MPSTNGTKVATSNRFDALNMDDTDDFGVPTKEGDLDVASGSTMRTKVDGSLKIVNASQ